MSFPRPRKNPADTRTVILDGALGKGGVGTVNLIKERSTEEAKGYPDILKVRGRVAKCIAASQANGLTHAEVRATAHKEYDRYKKMPHLHVKELVEYNDAYYIIMDRAPGNELFNIINDIYNDRLVINGQDVTLTTQQIVNLGIVVVKALQRQVHDLGFVHRDIKPENIMIDLSDPNNPDVCIIDPGYLKNVSENDSNRSPGTAGYISPESINKMGTTKKSDIFSLGVCLAYLFACDNSGKQNNHEKNRNISFSVWDYDSNNVLGWQTRKLFIDEEFNRVYVDVRKLIQNMCEPDPAKRYDLSRVLNGLHEIRLKLKMPAYLQVERDHIYFGHRAAISVLKELKPKNTINQIRALIQKHLKHDSPEAINEFTITLGMRALSRCSTKAELLTKIEAIADRHESRYQELNKIALDYAAFRAKYEHSPLFTEEQFGTVLKKYNDLAIHKMQKYQSTEYHTLDDFVEATNNIDRAVKKMPHQFEIMIERRCEQVLENAIHANRRDVFAKVFRSLNANEHADDARLQELKRMIKLGISNYLKKTATDKNITQCERAGSNRRIADMEEILAIVNDSSIKSQNDLRDQVKDRLDRIQTGFFGRSRLRDEVEQAFKHTISMRHLKA